MPSGAIITTLGLAKLASASPLNQLNISTLAVGDGSGGYPTLDPSMTALTNEVWRGTPSPPIRDPNSSNVLIFEAVIPPSVGGFTVREQAIFDDAGDMIAIGQTSVVEKPLPNAATGVMLTVRLYVQLDNSEQVDLFFQDDPTISAGNVSNANGGSVQDFIDAQYTTVAELATGKFQVGQYVRVTDRAMGLFLLQSGGTIDGIGVLDAGNSNTAVCIITGDILPEQLGATTSSDSTTVFQWICDNLNGRVNGKGKTFITNGIIGSSGIKFTDIKFNYTRNGEIVDVNKALEVDRKVARYMYVWGCRHVEEMFQLMELGYNTLVHYNVWYGGWVGGNMDQAMASIECTGIDVLIYHRTTTADTVRFDDSQRVKGYMLFDEPAAHGILEAQQSALLAEFRSATGKDLGIVENVDYGLGSDGVWANGFDFVFLDIYKHNSQTYAQTKTTAMRVYSQIERAVPTAVIIPAVGLFIETGTGFDDKPGAIEFGKEFFNISKDGSFCVFGWDPSRTGSPFSDVYNDQDFRDVARFLTTKVSRRYKINTVLGTPADSANSSIAEIVNATNYQYTNGLTPHSIINVGSAVDERHQAFGDKGLGFVGNGVWASRVLTDSYMIVRVEYKDYLLDGSADVSLIVSNADFFEPTVIDFSTLSNANSVFEKSFEGVTKGLNFGLSVVAPSALPMWRFLDISVITSTWLD